MTDLELLHNYTSMTYVTLSQNSVIREFYRTTVVQVGLSCDYIMRAILAVSSLHLAHHRPHMRERYQSIADRHYQVSMGTAVPLISNVTTETARLLFLYSILTNYYTFGLPRKSEDALLLSDRGFPDWVYLLQGAKNFVDVAGVPTSGPLVPLFKFAIGRYMLREAPEGSSSPACVPLAELEANIVQRLLDDEAGEDLRRIYVRSIDELRKSFCQAQACAARGLPYDLTDAFIWIHLVADDLLPLLHKQTQEAVAIFAFFCILLHEFDGYWWMQGWARQLIACAYNLLDEEGRLWIRWPVENIGWIPPSVMDRM